MTQLTSPHNLPYLEDSDPASVIDDTLGSFGATVDARVTTMEHNVALRGNLWAPTNNGIASVRQSNGLSYLPASGANRWARYGAQKLRLNEPPVTWIDQGGVARLEEYGSYRIIAAVGFAAGGTAGTRTIELRINATTPTSGSRIAITEDHTNLLTHLKVDTGPMLLNAGTTVNVFLYQNSGVNINFSLLPWMMVQRTHNSLAV